MRVILQIAFRNLKEHKVKSFIIGTLIAVGILLMTITNSIIDTALASNEKTFINNFTGHIMIDHAENEGVDIFGAGGGMMGEMQPVKTIPNYSEVWAYLNSLEGVQMVNPQVSGVAMLSFDDDQLPEGKEAFGGLALFGIEAEYYQNMFPDNLTILDGEFLSSETQGIMVPQQLIKEFKEKLDIELNVGDELKVQGFTSGSFRIRKFPIVGVFKYNTEVAALDGVSLIDAQSLRSLNGMVIGNSETVDIDESDAMFLDVSGDDIFGDDSLFGGDLISDAAEVEMVDVSELIGSAEDRAMYTTPDSGAWHFLLLKLDDSGAVDSTIEKLNAAFAEKGWPLEAQNWKSAASRVVTLIDGLQIFIIIVAIIFAFVAIIIIINTLIISIIERTSEIGTMRALGAEKGFIRKMFISETMAISLVFGTIGLILGGIIVMIFNIIGLQPNNEILEMLLGGETVHPIMSITGVVQSYIMMIIIGMLSSLYPVYTAMKIQPVKAIATN